jgi:hypothetical protein
MALRGKAGIIPKVSGEGLDRSSPFNCPRNTKLWTDRLSHQGSSHILDQKEWDERGHDGAKWRLRIHRRLLFLQTGKSTGRMLTRDNFDVIKFKCRYPNTSSPWYGILKPTCICGVVTTADPILATNNSLVTSTRTKYCSC